MHLTLALATVLCCAQTIPVANAQIFQPLHLGAQPLVALQPPPQQQVTAPRALAHRAVVLNSEAEARLPPQLQNPFYKNPRIEAALAKESWFTPDEQQVLNREADKIPRDKIYSILKNAGLLARRRR